MLALLHRSTGDLEAFQEGAATGPAGHEELGVVSQSAPWYMAGWRVGEDGLRKPRPRPARLMISVREQLRSRGEVFALWV
jgi:hypothetical protein